VLFNSFEFIFIFLPLLCVIFGFFHKKASLNVLLLGSFVFYAYHSISNLCLLISSISFNFVISKYIKNNKLVLFLAVSANIALIIYFKYYNFIAQNLSHILAVQIPYQDKALPLGISFFTFQQIAYLVDSYYGNYADRNFRSFALLVSFFPHSIAGPLVQYKDVAPQFAKVGISLENLSIGGTIFIIGLFKKIIIADGIAPSVNAIFDAAGLGIIPSFAESWFGAIGYTLQLYFDFSGYSDMAIGLARMFNVHFPINFNSPYKAASIIDFWHRWHMSLSKFLRDYLYIPLGGNRHSRYRNLLLTMLIGGLWHGANWTFILWGFLHGIYLIINHLWRDLLKKLGLTSNKSISYQVLSWILTIFCVIISWVLFRSDSLETAIVIYQSMFGFHGISVSPTLLDIIPEFNFINYEGFFKNQLFYVWDYLPAFVSSIIICLCLPNIKNLFVNYVKFEKDFSNFNIQSADLDTSLRWVPSQAYAILMAIMTIWIILALLSSRKIEFLYFNF